jgi:hypothetical protein
MARPARPGVRDPFVCHSNGCFLSSDVPAIRRTLQLLQARLA